MLSLLHLQHDCYARLNLYSYSEELERNVLYHDIDSIIYLDNGNVPSEPTGNYLGDMTDEFEKDFGSGSYITRFVSAGPKQYSYQVYCPVNSKKRFPVHVKLEV